MNYLPPIALVAIIGGVWGWTWWLERRFNAAVREGARRLNGYYQGGGAASGGSIIGKVGDRDIAFSFFRRNGKGTAEWTSVTVILRRDAPEKFSRSGADAVARVPALKPYDSWTRRLLLSAHRRDLSASFRGIVRDADRLVSLAGILGGLADEIEGGKESQV